MTPEILRWIKVHVPNEGQILEVGSLNINGSARQFAADRWVGVDMQNGPGVDITANAHCLPFDDESFSCAVCAEMLEHDDNPFVTLAELHRVLKPHGRLILTVPGIGFKRHDYPSDYWRFTVEGVKVLLRDWRNVQVEENGATMSVRAVATR